MSKVLLIGATGYSGAELLRLLLRHQGLDELVPVGKSLERPTPVGEVYPGMVGLTDLKIYPEAPDSDMDVVIFATPDGVTMRLADQWLERGARVIDFSGDTRLRLVKTHKTWYGIEHTAPHLLTDAVYGIPELNREQIKTAKVVANPGCYATCNIVALAPLATAGLLAGTVICDSKSGISGAGKHPKAPFQLPEASGNWYAYNVGKHKHVPEMEQVLSDLAGNPVTLFFTPQVVPASRGILSTIYVDMPEGGVDRVTKLYESFYGDEPFVRLLPQGQLPAINYVRDTNFCDIGIVGDERTGKLLLVSALDNLVKGAAGQALQNMNLMLGLEETEGMLFAGCHP